MYKKENLIIMKLSCIIGILIGLSSILILVKDFDYNNYWYICGILFNFGIVLLGLLVLRLIDWARKLFLVLIMIEFFNTVFVLINVAVMHLFIPLYLYQIMMLFSFVLFPNFIYFRYFSYTPSVYIWPILYWDIFLLFVILSAIPLLCLTSPKIGEQFKKRK